MKNLKKKNIFIVMANTDRTEGRGVNVPIAYTYNRFTAERMAKGRCVQGSDARIVPYEAFVDDLARVLAPVVVEHPTKDDAEKEVEYNKNQEEQRAKELLLKRVREMGLTDEEIELLKK